MPSGPATLFTPPTGRTPKRAQLFSAKSIEHRLVDRLADRLADRPQHEANKRDGRLSNGPLDSALSTQKLPEHSISMAAVPADFSAISWPHFAGPSRQGLQVLKIHVPTKTHQSVS